MSDVLSLKVRVTGRVQGVGYRAWTTERARAHGLTGWVRNEADGTVTAVFHGAVAAVQAMIDECRDGPPSAMVDHLSVDHVDEAPTGPFRISRL